VFFSFQGKKGQFVPVVMSSSGRFPNYRTNMEKIIMKVLYRIAAQFFE